MGRRARAARARLNMAAGDLVCPSILSADPAELGREVERVIAAGADMIHFDVMDNHYVPNLTYGPMVCAALAERAGDTPIDVHLMARPVDALIRGFAEAGASWISFHPEACDHVDRSLGLVRELGCRAGLVLNPATPLACLEYALERLDFVLLMGVNPGFGGQCFIPSTLAKLRVVRALIDDAGRDMRLEVDGGVNADNIGAIKQAGADTFVAGSAIFGAPDYAQAIDELREALDAATDDA